MDDKPEGCICTEDGTCGDTPVNQDGLCDWCANGECRESFRLDD